MALSLVAWLILKPAEGNVRTERSCPQEGKKKGHRRDTRGLDSTKKTPKE
jgi:hypothetical protein